MNTTKQQIATTRDQSARLLKCGVPAESADMFRWVNSYGQEFLETYHVPSPAVSLTPAWSLSALLTNVLPSNIRFEGHTCLLEIVSSNWQSDEQIWEVAYDIDLGVEASDPIEACVQMVEMLIAQGYALNGIEKGGEE